MSVRADLHNSDGLARYISGMDATQQDKARILTMVTPKSSGLDFLELGCGSGAVLMPISECEDVPVNSITGLDFSARLLAEASSRQYKSAVKLARANILEPGFIPYIQNKKFDHIILCSVLHEVWSQFPVGDSREYHMKNFLRSWQPYLRKGGSILIRDGVAPDRAKIQVRFKNKEVQDKFFRFADDFKLFLIEFEINVDELGTSIMVDSRSLYEFLTKYFYDANWDIEVKEQFGWTDKESLSDLALSSGYQLTHFETYTLPYLANKWNADFEIFKGTKPYLPASTMLSRLTVV